MFSENSRKNAARVHKLTGQVASVSAKTSGVIADSARGVGAYVSGKGKKDDKEDKKPGEFVWSVLLNTQLKLPSRLL